MSELIQFKNLSNRLSIKSNGNNISLSSWYPKDSITIDKIGGGYGEPYETLRYSAKNDDNIESNQASIIINFPPNKNVNPECEITIANLQEESSINLEDYIVFNEGVDRLRINDYNLVGVLKYNNSNIYKGQVVMSYDFDKITYHADKGQGKPYYELTFQVGNSLSYSSQKKFIANKEALAYIEDPEINIYENTASTLIKIKDSVVNSTAKLKVIVSTDSLIYFNPEEDNSVFINDKEILRTGEYEFIVQTNNIGEFNMPIEINSQTPIGDNDIKFEVRLVKSGNDSYVNNIDLNRNVKTISIRI